MRGVAHVAFLLLLTGVTALLGSDRPSLPPPSGSYGIGRIGYELIESSRPEPLSSKPNAPQNDGVLWYPTNKKSGNEAVSAPYLPGLDEAKSKVSVGDIADMFSPATYEGPQSPPPTVVVDHAPIARGSQKFPMLLFAHGWGNPIFRTQRN